VKFLWTADCSAAFNELKQALISDNVMIAPDFEQEMIVETDASDIGIGGVLSQLNCVTVLLDLSRIEVRNSITHRRTGARLKKNCSQ